MMRHQGALFGNGPFSLLPHIHPSLIGGGPTLPPPPPPLHGFKSYRLPYPGLHPFLIPHAMAPIALPIPQHRNVIIKHKLIRSPYMPYALPPNRNGNHSSLTFKLQKQPYMPKIKTIESKTENVDEKSKGITSSIVNGAAKTKPESNEPGPSTTSAIKLTNGESNSSSDSAQQQLLLSIPPEMTKPLFCELCEAKLNSPLQATSHYEGKNHAKKVRFYLEREREKMGEKTPLPPPPPPASNKAETVNNKKDTLEEEYCKLCDVAFTSVVQAAQHHNGRNHQRRLRGENPLPKGFFNPSTRKWQRQPPSLFFQFHKQRSRMFSKSYSQIAAQRIKVGF